MRIPIEANIHDQVFLHDFDALEALGKKWSHKSLPEYGRMAAILRKLFVDNPAHVEVFAERYKTKVWVLKVFPKGWDRGTGQIEKVPRAFVECAPPMVYMDLKEQDLEYYTFPFKSYLDNYVHGVVFGLQPKPRQLIKYYANYLGGVHSVRAIDTADRAGLSAAEVHKFDEVFSYGENPGSRLFLDQCALDLYHAALPFARALREIPKLQESVGITRCEELVEEWFRPR